VAWRLGDEAGTSGVGEVGPGPLEEDEDAVAESNEEVEVNEGPGQPCRCAAELKAFEIGNAGVASDGGEAAFVEIPEVLWRFAADHACDVFGGVFAALHGGGSDAGDGTSFFIFDAHGVPDDLDFGMAGNAEGLFDEGASGTVDGAFELADERGGGIARSPDEGAGGKGFVVELHGFFRDGFDHGVEADIDLEMLELPPGAFGKLRGVGGQDTRTGLDEQNMGLLRVDAAEVLAEREAGEFGDGSGHFDAGGASSDDDEGHFHPAGGFVFGFFSFFEGGEDAPAELGGVLKAFETGSAGFPFRVSEVGVTGARGEDEVVVMQGAFGAGKGLGLYVDGGDFGHGDAGVFLITENGANGFGDVRRGEARGGHLVEQGLEEMVVRAIHEYDADGCILEREGGGESTEASTDDYDDGQA